MTKALPDIIGKLHISKTGSLFTPYDAHDSDDGSVSPSSSPPRGAALMAHARNPRFPLSPIDEGRVMRGRSQSEGTYEILQMGSFVYSNTRLRKVRTQANGEIPDEYPNSWTWETRHIKSTTLIVAAATSTAYFCLDFPEKLRKRISKAVHSLQALSTSPLFMDTLIVDEVINFYRDAIKSHRNQMLAMVRPR